MIRSLCDITHSSVVIFLKHIMNSGRYGSLKNCNLMLSLRIKVWCRHTVIILNLVLSYHKLKHSFLYLPLLLLLLLFCSCSDGTNCCRTEREWHALA
jgi:hypothetical protein